MRTLDRLVAEKVMGFYCDVLDDGALWVRHAGPHWKKWSPSTDMNAAMEVEAHVITLARWNDKIVPHRVETPTGYAEHGLPLLETYVGHLWRIVGGTEYEKTCMGDNNWAMLGRVRIATLYALAHATPKQRCLAALAAVGVEYKESDNG